MKNSLYKGGYLKRVHTVALLVLAVCLLTGQAAFAQGCQASIAGSCPWGFGGVSVSTGYFGLKQGTDISFSASERASGSLTELRQQIDVGGINVEVAAPFRWNGPFGVIAGGRYAAYFQRPSLETAQIDGGFSRTRTWRTQPQDFDVYAAFTMDLYSTLTGMVGVRYENFQTNFSNPDLEFGSSLGSLDSATISLNAFVPYMGVVYGGAPGLFGMNLHAGLIGSPVMLGNVDYRETAAAGFIIGGRSVPGFNVSNNLGYGYLVEAFADSSIVTPRGIQLGAYVKYSAMKAVSNVSTGQANGNIPQVVYKFDLQKRNWEIGGRVWIFF